MAEVLGSDSARKKLQQPSPQFTLISHLHNYPPPRSNLESHEFGDDLGGDRMQIAADLS